MAPPHNSAHTPTSLSDGSLATICTTSGIHHRTRHTHASRQRVTSITSSENTNSKRTITANPGEREPILRPFPTQTMPTKAALSHLPIPLASYSTPSSVSPRFRILRGRQRPLTRLSLMSLQRRSLHSASLPSLSHKLEDPSVRR